MTARSPGCAGPGWRSGQQPPGRRARLEAAFAEWSRSSCPARTFWLTEVGTERSGSTAIGLDQRRRDRAHAPTRRPPGRIGHIGDAFVLASFADRGVPAALLDAVVEHARERRYRRLLLAPTAGEHGVLPPRRVRPGRGDTAGDGPASSA